MERLLLMLHHMMTQTRDWHERREVGGIEGCIHQEIATGNWREDWIYLTEKW
jgi:hypothetical protein